jgi:hypothetical protein
VRAVWSIRVIGLSKSAIALATRFVRVVGLSERYDRARVKFLVEVSMLG